MADNSQPSDERLARFWRRKPLLLMAFGIVITMTIFFGARTFIHMTSLTHRVHDEVRPWMRPAYIARTFNIEEDVLYQTIGIEIDSREHRLSLAQIARRKGIDKTDLIKAVQHIVETRDDAGASR